MKLFAQIRKVDEERRLVYGRAADETLDKSNERLDYIGSKPHFVKWSDDVSKDSGGKSLGNVRAMHGKVAAGVLKGIDFSDADKAIDVCAHIVDDQEWRKVLSGTYTGFSIGGAYGTKTVTKVDNQDITSYIAIPNEISLVDRPCIPSAKFFEVQKADGSLAKVEFQEHVEEPPNVEVNGTPDDVEELGKVMNEKGLTVAQVIALAKGENPFAAKDDDEAPEGHDKAAWAKMTPEEKKAAKAKKTEKSDSVNELSKSMYECSQFANVLASLISLKKSAEYEAYLEGDSSPLPQRIGAVISLAGQVFKEMIDEAMAESKAGTGVPAPLMAMAEQTGDLAKRDEDPLLTLVKLGARNSSADKGRIEAIHQASVELGAECTAAEKVEKLEPSDALTKLVADAVAPLQKALTEATEKITKLEAEPRTPRVSLRAVSKAEDNGDVATGPGEADLVKDSSGAVHPAASLIKQAMTNGGQPLYRG